jgi:hypothetical protein
MSTKLRALRFLALLTVFVVVPDCATAPPVITHTLSCAGVDFMSILPDVEKDLFAGDYAALEGLAGRFTFDVVACAVRAAMTKASAVRGEHDKTVANGQTWLDSHHTVVAK